MNNKQPNIGQILMQIGCSLMVIVFSGTFLLVTGWFFWALISNVGK